MAAIWVLTADGAKARIFAADAPMGALEERETFVNPEGRAKQRDLKTDRPGETSPRMGRGRRATEPDVSPREHALHQFAKLLVDHLEAGRTGNDFERILPAAIAQFAPPGILGLIVAGLIAAFTGTFAGTLNAGVAYIVNDVYRRHINPAATRATLIYGSYATAVLVVALSTFVGLSLPSINSVLQWIVSVAGVLVFAGLTAYDTQQIKEMYYVGDDGTIAGRKAVMGALRLYLDFINLFTMLLPLFGQRQDYAASHRRH